MASLLLLLQLGLSLVDPANAQRRTPTYSRRPEVLNADAPSAADDSAALAAADLEMRRFVPRGSSSRSTTAPPPSAPSPSSRGARGRGRVQQTDDDGPAAAPAPSPSFPSRSRSRASPAPPLVSPSTPTPSSSRRRPEQQPQQQDTADQGRRSSSRRRPSSYDGVDGRGGRALFSDTPSPQSPPPPPPPPLPATPSPTYRRREPIPTPAPLNPQDADEEGGRARGGFRSRSRSRRPSAVTSLEPSLTTEAAPAAVRPRPDGVATRRRPSQSPAQGDLRQYKATPLEVATALQPVPPAVQNAATDKPLGRGIHRFKPHSKDATASQLSAEKEPAPTNIQIDDSENYPQEFKEKINNNSPTRLTRLPSFSSRTRLVSGPLDSSNEPRITTKLRPALSSSIQSSTDLRSSLKPAPPVEPQANALDDSPPDEDGVSPPHRFSSQTGAPHRPPQRLPQRLPQRPHGPSALHRPQLGLQSFQPASREVEDEAADALQQEQGGGSREAPAAPAPIGSRASLRSRGSSP